MHIKERVRGYLPVVIDIETAGFNHQTDAMLEICAVIIGIDKQGRLYPKSHNIFIRIHLRVLILNRQHSNLMALM